MLKKLIKKALKVLFGRYYLILISKFKFAGGGLTSIPSNSEATISDLFLWRKDPNWSSFFELLDIKYLINPNDEINRESIAKFIFFNNFGEEIFEKNIYYSNEGRKTINISNILPDSINGYGTFSCFHITSNTYLNETKSFFAERGYCGYSRNDNICKSYVHGNLDAVAYNNSKIEMLGNYNKRTYFYNLQYEFLAGINYEIIITNPTRNKQSITLNFTNLNELDEIFTLNPRGSLVKKLFFKENIKVRLIVKSNIYMARPIIFRYHDNSLDVFHG
jgi:hypothetical protein